MDDGWQQCNCSTHQDMDPTLPSCSIGDCRGGRCSFHSPVDGAPMVNPHRFPTGMKSLVDYGHSLGLKVGTCEDMGLASARAVVHTLAIPLSLIYGLMPHTYARLSPRS